MEIKEKFKRYASEFVLEMSQDVEEVSKLSKILNGCDCGCNNGGFIDFVLQESGTIKIKEMASQFTNFVEEKGYVDEETKIFLLKFLYSFIEFLKNKENKENK